MFGWAYRSAALVVALSAGACAQAPGSIAPVQVNAAQYRGATCDDLFAQEARLNRTLAGLYAEQSQSRTDDVIGYLFLLAPTASLSGGDLRHQIALRKGQREAIGVALARNCSGSRPSARS